MSEEQEKTYSFEYQGKTLAYTQNVADRVLQCDEYRRNQGKMVSIGVTQMFITEERVKLRKNGTDAVITGLFPDLDMQGREALVAHIIANHPPHCTLGEGDVSKANKGCC